MRKLLFIASLMLATACSGPGETFDPPEWLQVLEAPSTTSQGVTLVIFHVHSQQSLLFRDMEVRSQSNLAMNYALFPNNRLNGDLLLPQDIVVTDDTGALRLKGRASHLASIEGVSIGFVQFPGGPLETSNALHLSVRAVAIAKENLRPESVLQGEWPIHGFLTVRTRPPKEKSQPGYLVRGTGGSEIALGSVVVKVDEVFHRAPKGGGLSGSTPVWYNRWRIVEESGKESELFWAELRDGSAQAISPEAYLKARTASGLPPG